MPYRGPATCVIVAAKDADDTNGPIRYDIDVSIPGSGIIRLEDIVSACGGPAGSGAVAAPVATEWPVFFHASGNISAYIVEAVAGTVSNAPVFMARIVERTVSVASPADTVLYKVNNLAGFPLIITDVAPLFRPIRGDALLIPAPLESLCLVGFVDGNHVLLNAQEHYTTVDCDDG
jgi:hypothetical protein